jgi:C-terminal processing protease CtpA/Prc
MILVQAGDNITAVNPDTMRAVNLRNMVSQTRTKVRLKEY